MLLILQQMTERASERARDQTTDAVRGDLKASFSAAAFPPSSASELPHFSLSLSLSLSGAPAALKHTAHFSSSSFLHPSSSSSFFFFFFSFALLRQ